MANKKEYSYKTHFTDTDMREGESVEHYYRRLAKVADQRLVRLEALAHEQGFKGVLKYSYAGAIHDIEIYSGKGAKRFNTKMPTDSDVLDEKIAAMIKFLHAPTSTKQSITEIYKNRAKTLSDAEHFGETVSWQEVADVFEALEDSESGGSPTKVKAIGIVKSISKYGFEKAKQKNKHMDDEIALHLAEIYLKGDNFNSFREAMNISEEKREEILSQWGK